MSSVSVGKRWEREARTIVEGWGYAVETAIPKTVWAKGKTFAIAHDFWNVWDGLGVALIDPPRYAPIIFYQVTNWEHLSHKVKKIKESPVKWIDLPCATAIFCRMTGRNAHFRVCWGGDQGYEWKGHTEMVKK